MLLTWLAIASYLANTMASIETPPSQNPAFADSEIGWLNRPDQEAVLWSSAFLSVTFCHRPPSKMIARPSGSMYTKNEMAIYLTQYDHQNGEPMKDQDHLMYKWRKGQFVDVDSPTRISKYGISTARYFFMSPAKWIIDGPALQLDVFLSQIADRRE